MQPHLSMIRQGLACLLAAFLAFSFFMLSEAPGDTELIPSAQQKKDEQKKKGEPKKKDGQEKKKKDQKDKKNDKSVPKIPEKKVLPKDKTPPISVLKGHKDWINSVAYSKDGQHLITAGRDRTVRIWDTATGKEVKALEKHPTNVMAALFTPDGTLAVATTGEWDKKDKKWQGEIRIWDIQQGKVVRTFKGHTAPIECLAFSPDGKKIVTAGEDNTAIIWDFDSGKVLHTLKADKDTGHKEKIYSVAFSPDGTKIATASADKTVKIWDASTGKELHTLKGTDRDMTSIAFSPDGKLLAAGSLDAHIYVWNTADQKEVKKLEAPEGIWSIAFSPDGSLLVGAGWNDTLKVWDVSGWAEKFYRNGHDRTVTDIAFSPDGSRLASVGIDQTIQIWDMPVQKAPSK